MTTLLYTPGRLVGDSRSTNTELQEVASDDVQKIRRFGDPAKPLDLSQALSFKGDRIYLAAGTGNSEVIEVLVENLGRFGEDVLEVYNRGKRAFGDRLYSSSGSVVLVGEKELHYLVVRPTHPDKFLDYSTYSLDEPRGFGSGGQTAKFLHTMFGVPEALAVAATGLIDHATGGDIIECYRTLQDEPAQVHWMERRHRYLDVDDLVDALTDYFSGWNVGTHPFKLPHLPRRRRPTKYVKVERKHTVKAASKRAAKAPK